MQDLSGFPAPFDQQSKVYDKRAGLDEFLCKSIAGSIRDVSHLLHNDRLVEIGCGTGQIGSQLDRLSNYSGFDISSGMLDQFSAKYPDLKGSIFRSDGKLPWLFEDNSVKVVFSSRALHWLDVDHVVKETYRVSSPSEAYLFVGRIERSPDCWEKSIRKHMHKLLKENRILPLDGQKNLEKVRVALMERGATVVDPIEVGSWRSSLNMNSVIKNWADKNGLAGKEVPDQLKNHILSELLKWAEKKYGTPSPSGTMRHYMIYGFKL